MQKINIKWIFIRSGIFIWSISCILVFIYFPARVSTISGANFNNWPFLLSNLGRIAPLNFLSNLFWAIIGVIIFSAICVIAGGFSLRMLADRVSASSSSRLTRLALLGTAFSIGQGLLSTVFFGLAKFGLFTPIHVIIVLVIAIAVGISPITKYCTKSQIKEIFNPFEKLDTTVDIAIGWLNISALALSLLYSTSRLSYDSVALYFSSAKITAMTNHLQFFSKFFIVSSFQTGIQYAALIQVFGDQAARMYSWVNGVIIIIFTIAIGERVGLSKRANLVLVTLILTSTAFLDLMGDGKIELASTVPAIAAIYWMAINNKHDKGILLLIGFLAGLAMISRPNNIFLLAMVIGLFYLLHAFYLRKNDMNWIYVQFVKPLLWISVGVVCLLTYHIIANWVMLGDPLAFIRTYEGVDWSQWQWALSPEQVWNLRLYYPLVVTYMNNPQSLGNITPLFVAFLPAGVVLGFGKKLQITRDLTILMFAALISLIIWLLSVLTIFEIRYVLFLWILLFLPASLIIDNLSTGADPFLQNNTKFLLIFLLLVTIIRIIYISIDVYSPIDSLGNPQCYDIPFCKLLKPVNEIASTGDRVLTLNAYRYYLRTDLFACATTLDEYTTLENLSHEDSTAFWTEVYREGYKFITYESNYSVWHLTLGLIPNPFNTPPWLSLKPIYGHPGDPEVSYQIQAKDPPIEPLLSCQKSSSGVWKLTPMTK